MSSRIVRSSKYRHVFCDPPKADEAYTNLQPSTQTGDHQYIKGSTKFFSVAVKGGGGPVWIGKLDEPGRLPPAVPHLAGHHGAVFDTDWNPFNPNMVATSSDDTTVKIWGIPDEGLKENISDPLATLEGHGKPVTFVEWNPCANNVMASAGKDHCCKIWDVQKQEAVTTIDGWDGIVQDLHWDPEGKLLLISSKDKKFRVFDARSKDVVAEVAAHEGAKCAKGTFMENGRFLTCGFTKQSGREMRLWDLKDTSKKLKKVEIDTASGVIIPFYDQDTRMLYLAGKGDGNIRYYELDDEKPFIHELNQFRSNDPAKGMCMLPKRANDIKSCEVAKFLKLTPSAVEPLHFCVPRKSEAFQDDIFPDHAGFAPGNEAEAWFGGESVSPPKSSMDPGSSGGAAGGAGAKFTVSKSAAQLQRELDEALARIKELEAENEALKAKLA